MLAKRNDTHSRIKHFVPETAVEFAWFGFCEKFESIKLVCVIKTLETIIGIFIVESTEA